MKNISKTIQHACFPAMAHWWSLDPNLVSGPWMCCNECYKFAWSYWLTSLHAR
jgi:hypothetical protein